MDENVDVRSLPIVMEQYEELNYEIHMTDSKTKNCLICFSGHGLYFPNTLETFENRIIDNNRFEWKKVNQNKIVEKKFKKIIYVRDIWKTWYLYGINSSISNTERLLKFLQNETQGYDVYTVGNSAGGYAAVQYGCLLNAVMVYNYSGQYEIDSKDYWNIENCDNEEIKKERISILNLINNSTTKIAYFIPDEAKTDLEQYEKVKGCSNILPFFIRSRWHGTTVLGVNYKYIFDMSIQKIEKLCKKYGTESINRYHFLFSTTGIIKGIFACCEMVAYKLKHRDTVGL